MKLKPEQRAFFAGFREWVEAQPPERQRQIRTELRLLLIERLWQLHFDTVASELLQDVDLSEIGAGVTSSGEQATS